MTLRPLRLLRDLGRTSGSSLVQLLLDHLGTGREGVRLATQLVEGASSGDAAQRAMSDLEHKGDLLRGKLASGLSKALVTPIDREDLYRLSRSIDDVLDNLRDFVREWSIYGPVSGAMIPPLLGAIDEALEELERAVSGLTGPIGAIAPLGIAAKRACNQVRRSYEEELGRLFAEELTMEVLKERELLRRLDVVGLRLDEAVDILLDAAIKRGA
jgi:hypothetical protein